MSDHWDNDDLWWTQSQDYGPTTDPPRPLSPPPNPDEWARRLTNWSHAPPPTNPLPYVPPHIRKDKYAKTLAPFDYKIQRVVSDRGPRAPPYKPGEIILRHFGTEDVEGIKKFLNTLNQDYHAAPPVVVDRRICHKGKGNKHYESRRGDTLCQCSCTRECREACPTHGDIYSQNQ